MSAHHPLHSRPLLVALLSIGAAAWAGACGSEETTAGGGGAGGVIPGDPCSPEGEVVSCYPGSASTRNMGACRDGTSQCTDGRWSTCEGFTLPVDEACNDVDDDCNGVADDGLPCGAGGQGGAEPCTWGPFGAPVVLANVNSGADDYDPCLSADGLELYFASDRSPGLGQSDLWLATRDDVTEDFGAPALVANVNAWADDEGPFLAADGLSLWLHSWRDEGPGDARNLWVSTRASTTVAFPAATLVAVLNTDDGEGDPHLSDDLLRMYFASDRSGSSGGYDIWFAERPSIVTEFGTPTRLAEVSSSDRETDPTLTSDELTMLLMSNRPGSLASDIYLATRSAITEPFGEPVALAEVNGTDPTDDYAPYLSRDGATLLFASNRAGGVGGVDLWMATRACE